MADNTAKTLKIARLVALAHIVVGVLLFIFGIADRVHGYFWTGEGCFGIWCGVWVGCLRSNIILNLFINKSALSPVFKSGEGRVCQTHP